MIQIQISSISGLELKEPATIYGWCSYQNTDETHVIVNVAWNLTKEEARASKGQIQDTRLVTEVTKLLNDGESKKVEGKQMFSPVTFAVEVANIKGSGFEECKKSIELEVQKSIEAKIKAGKKLKK